MKNIKATVLIFLFHILFWLGYTYITKGNDEWNWKRGLIISLLYAIFMTFMHLQQNKNKELYLAAGQGKEVVKYLISQGYVEKKQKDETTFFKKKGFFFNPFIFTTVKESSFYTRLVASQSTIEKVPEYLERIRQPTTAN